MDYDAIVVGGGPAGLSAGTRLAQAGFSVLLLDKESFGGRVMNVEWIDGYPGADERVAGAMLASEMVNEAAQSGVQMEVAEVVEIEAYSGCRSVACADGRTFTSTVVILAGGVRSRKLGVPGEDKLQGKGMIHCAMCDAGLYRDQVVAVCGGGDAGIIEAIYLARHASKVVVIESQGRLTSNPTLQAQAQANPKLDIRCGVTAVEIAGGDSVTGIKLENAATGRSEVLQVQGVLVQVGFEPPTDYLAGAVPLDDRGYIDVSTEMETAVPGIFAAGDIRSGSTRRVVAAVSDGRMAAERAQQFLKLLSQEA